MVYEFLVYDLMREMRYKHSANINDLFGYGLSPARLKFSQTVAVQSPLQAKYNEP